NGVIRSITYDTDFVMLEAEMERPFAEHLQKQAREMAAGEVRFSPLPPS
ncbi:MAG: hypothetical protein IMHGJWDQ_002033, partial [Candidatus Fervidibacter sp.]